MIGIVLMSHGEMAKGMYNSCTLFFGNDIPQLEYVCLKAGETPEEYEKRVNEAISKVDTGDGVIGMVDLLNGTPCNTCALKMNENFKVITGMNLTTLLELLGTRLSVEKLSDLDINTLVQTGKDGVKDLFDFLSHE